MESQDKERAEHASRWRFRWPNTADFNYDYYRLLNQGPIGSCPPDQGHRIAIAIVGAGVAGLTAARELYRAGYRNIHIFEASHRIGGRAWSELAPGFEPGKPHTVYELGAMRFPFFTEPEDHNCVLDYYRKVFNLQLQAFPNPGSDVCDTGIFCGEQWVVWEKGEEPKVQPYRRIHDRWKSFKQQFRKAAEIHYNAGDQQWRTFWLKVAKHYDSVSFKEFVEDKPHNDQQKQANGYFGGLGLSPRDAERFGIVGAGDGGWGAFYDRNTLWVIRTLGCGFGDNLQLIGGSTARGALGRGPVEYVPFEKPLYLGVQALPECLYFEPVGNGESLYKANPDVQLHLKCKVVQCRSVQEGNSRSLPKVEVTWEDGNPMGPDAKALSPPPSTYDAVILTPAVWALRKIDFADFDRMGQRIIGQLRTSMQLSHAIASCKIFFPLKERYWDKGIPQVLVTDTDFRDAYGYHMGSGEDEGVLLASYTWEDNTHNLSSSDKDTLGAACLKELDKILKKSPWPEAKKRGISDFVAKDPTTGQPKAKVWSWLGEEYYGGCAKIPSPRSWRDDYNFLVFNQKYSRRTGLYLAGEGRSVEGGWLEPALRSALDAVIHIICNTTGGGLPDHYPEYRWPADDLEEVMIDQGSPGQETQVQLKFLEHLLEMTRDVDVDATLTAYAALDDWLFWLKNFRSTYKATMHIALDAATSRDKLRHLAEIQHGHKAGTITRYYLCDSDGEVHDIKWEQMKTIDSQTGVKQAWVLMQDLQSDPRVRDAIGKLCTDDFALIDGRWVRRLLRDGQGGYGGVRISNRKELVEAADLVLQACKSKGKPC
jgi:tryptophan 2-monooxygenase